MPKAKIAIALDPDILERLDGDHKLLGVPVVADPHAPATLKRCALARKRVWAWSLSLETPVTRWGGEDTAIAVIESCRQGAGSP